MQKTVKKILSMLWDIIMKMVFGLLLIWQKRLCGMKKLHKKVMPKQLCVLPFSMHKGKVWKKMRKKLSLTWNRLQKPEIPTLSIMRDAVMRKGLG